jgi:hypothetical protein
MGIKVIVTGTTGMVGEGVLLHCLEDPRVEKVPYVVRTCGRRDGKLCSRY